MLSEDEIRNALHASRVVPLNVPNPHGPMGLEQLAAAVVQMNSVSASAQMSSVRRPIELRIETWQKLDRIAHGAAATGSAALSASDVAITIIEQFVAANSLGD